MSLGIQNRDSSFFLIESDDINLKDVINNRDVLSLTINEEAGKLPTGSIEIYDQNNTYSHLMRQGVKLSISWGYTDPDLSPLNLLRLAKNPTEISGSFIRRGFTAFVKSPSGRGDKNATRTYSCNFQALADVNTQQNRVFNAGTKGSVVFLMMLDLGAVPFIDFARGTEVIIPGETSIRVDNESPFRFLNRVAGEWGAIFRIGFSPIGLPIGLFCEPGSQMVKSFTAATVLGVGEQHLLEYGGGIKNVLEYTWAQNDSDSQGANTQIIYVNGQPIFLRLVANTEKVVTWKLNTEQIKADMRGLPTKQLVAKYQEILKADDFDYWVTKKYFVPYETTTAPQGAGYNLTAKTFGNPLFTAPSKVAFGDGFPSRFQFSIPTNNIFYLRKVAHQISRSGYMCDLSIADAWSVSGGSLVG